jgi:predicted negative regulator of RcsB-dependent stress response
MSHNISFPKVLLAANILAAGALAVTLVGCDEIQSASTTHRPTPMVSSTTPPTPTPLPPPTAVLPPKPEVAPETIKPDAKPEPFVITEEDKQDPVAGARKALAAGDREAALKLAQLGVRRTPKRSNAWNILGRVQLQGGQRKDAIASFEKAVELNQRNSYAHNNLGLALIYDKQFEEAVDELEQAVELEPVEAYMWNNLGMAYEHLDRLEEARDAYSQAIEMESGRARDSLARLKGVETVVRTAKVEPEKLVPPEADDDKPMTEQKEGETKTP